MQSKTLGRLKRRKTTGLVSIGALGCEQSKLVQANVSKKERHPTDKRMYEACGILYSNGLVGNKVKKESSV